MKYLAHHGILGQKWGVRRYQNEDGTLTAAGKKRYQEGSSFGSKGRETRAKDAAELKADIQKYENRGEHDVAKFLSKYYNTLVKDLDSREIKFAENYYKIKSAQLEASRKSRKISGLTGVLAGREIGDQLGGSSYYRDRYSINKKYSNEIAENKELAKLIKAARKNKGRG